MSFNYSISRSVAAALAAGVLAAPAFADDSWETKIFGRLMIDYTAAGADNADYDVNGSEVRRARIGASGKSGGVSYKLEFDTDSSGEIEITDGYVEFKPEQSNWLVRVGQFNTPNSLDRLTSSRFSNTIERAAFNDAFQFGRRLGVSADTKGDNWTFSAGIFASDVNDSATEEGYALAARFTATPVKTDDMLVHLGTSVRYRSQSDEQGLLRYRQRPFSRNTDRIISTGGVAESDTFLGVEGAVISGGAFATAEYGFTKGDGPAGDSDLSGGYVEAGYVFGGSKAYKGGKFDRFKVDNPVSDGGYGAVALVARFDTIDLSDAPVDGGTLDTIILGADWLPTKYTRLSLNLFQSDAAFGDTSSGIGSEFAAARTAGFTGDKFSGALVRLGFDF